MSTFESNVVELKAIRQRVEGSQKQSEPDRLRTVQLRKAIMDEMVRTGITYTQVQGQWVELERRTPNAKLDDAMYVEIYIKFHQHEDIMKLDFKSRAITFPQFISAYIANKGEEAYGLKFPKTEPTASRVDSMMGSM